MEMPLPEVPPLRGRRTDEPVGCRPPDRLTARPGQVQARCDASTSAAAVLEEKRRMFACVFVPLRQAWRRFLRLQDTIRALRS